jgi:choline dehydrogenase-like flavoprotein
VLEQGPWRKPSDFRHDELGNYILGKMSLSAEDFPQTFRRTEKDEAERRPAIFWAQGVGGSSVHFTANYWRFHPVDFDERSRLGPIAGTGLADWPITYAELEPYYTRVEWEVGVSGAPGPFDPPRSRPFPMPPLPVKSSGVLFERGARKLGLHPHPAPMAITSQPYDGRSACMQCGYCLGFGCEFNAKSSTLATMIPKAMASGRCELRTESTAFRVETDAAGRATGVAYWDAKGVERRQRARAVVLAANGAETPRLLLLSTSPRHPDGLANSSGLVGKHLMFNAYASIWGTFEHPLNEYKGPQVTRIVHDYYDSDPKRGFYGGGGLDARMSFGPLIYALGGLPPGTPRWGRDYKRSLHELFTRTIEVASHTTSLPLAANSISLDPKVKDKFGRPAIRVTYADHPDDVKMTRFLQDRSREILQAAGARRVWGDPFEGSGGTAHLLGTARMGNDPRSSVVDRFHRAHDVRNLFVCDGSSLVTSGRGQPTMTIQALAFRAAEHIARFARANEI